ncbi:uncharacterized protein V6R79_003165, partial [Siganus canaliculatus]
QVIQSFNCFVICPHQQIVAEFVRLTSVDLKGSLYAGLDQHLERFLEMYKAKTNNVGLRRMLDNLQDNATDDEDKYKKGVKVGIVIVKD